MGMVNKLKIIKRRFKSSIYRGTGEAVLIMMNHPELDVSRDILNGARHYVGYDPQCEGGREEYFIRLIDLSPRKDEIVRKILQILSKATDKHWDYGMSQLNDIASTLAKRGNERARRILYQLAGKNLGSETALIEADGIDALKFIAGVKGKLLLQKSRKLKDDWTIEDDFLIKTAKEAYPALNPKKELEKEAIHNRDVKRFLSHITRAKRQTIQKKTPQPTYKSIIEMIARSEKVRRYVGRLLSKRDLALIARDMLNERDLSKIQQYLWIFTVVPFPLGCKPLVKYVRIKNAKIRWFSIQALALFKDASVRKLAIKQIKAGNNTSEYLNLLAMNYRESDNKLILDTFKSMRNKEAFHRAGHAIRDIFDANSTKRCVDALVEIYNRSSCSLCRRHAVRIMAKNGVLSETIKNEINYDSYIKPEDLNG